MQQQRQSVEEIVKELARLHAEASFLAGKVIREITAKQIEDTRRKLSLTAEDLYEFVEYLKTPEGSLAFKKECLLELWKLGFRTKDWEE